MTFTIVSSFGGVTHGAGTDIAAIIPDRADVSLSVSLELIARGERPPDVSGVIWESREWVVDLLKPAGSTLSSEAWWTFAAGVYAPQAGRRTVQVTHEGVTLETEVYVVRCGLVGPEHGQAVLHQPDPVWRAATPATVSASPYTPGGNYPAAATITYSRAATGNWCDVTITDTTGNGLRDYLVMIGGGVANAGGNFNTSGVGASAATNFLVFGGGRPVPFIVLNPGHATLTTVFVRVSVLPGGTETVRILWASSISNTLTANALDPMGMHLDHASFTNAAWYWRVSAGTIGGQTAPSIWQLSRNPARVPGVWYADATNFHAAGDVFNILEEVDQVQIGWGQGEGAVVADSMVLTTGGVRVASGLVMQGFAPVLDTSATAWPPGMMLPIGGESGGGATYESGTVRYLRAEDRAFLPATFTDPDFDVTDAIVVAIGPPSRNRLLVVSEHATDGPPRIALNSADIPTVTIGAAEAIVHGSFTLTNSTLDQSIQVSDVFWADADGDLVIDTRTREITPLDLLWQDDDDGLSFSERFGAFEFQQGVANSYALTGSGSVAITAADRYVL